MTWMIRGLLLAHCRLKSDCFVTGDAELLALKMVGKLPIVSPRVCWEKWCK